MFKKILALPIAVILLLAFLFMQGWLVMATWNFTMPFILGLPAINLYHGLAISILAGLLFGRTSKSQN